jgi:hypothetical protein
MIDGSVPLELLANLHAPRVFVDRERGLAGDMERAALAVAITPL